MWLPLHLLFAVLKGPSTASGGPRALAIHDTVNFIAVLQPPQKIITLDH